MFERLDSGARGALFQARLAAFGSPLIEPRHLLAGLAADASGRRVLEALGIDPEALAATMPAGRPAGDHAEPALAEATRRVLRLAQEESAASPALTAGHLVAGLLRHEATSGGGVLHDLGVSLQRARDVAAAGTEAAGPPLPGTAGIDEALRPVVTLDRSARVILFRARLLVTAVGDAGLRARHLLLALVAEDSGREALATLGADLASLELSLGPRPSGPRPDAFRDHGEVAMAEDLAAVLRGARAAADAQGALLVPVGALVLALLEQEAAAGPLHAAGMTLDEATRRFRARGGASPTPP